ncbi:Maf family nucleotide pyrophosphatase [Yimella sp. RIT 621]|uniref:Maf family protein n=1 Tax=Yimella sp. RIT 621 TaxID=2510323 RepID=UPI001F0ED99C|nr:Maf family nucleotide pyrophosphatase [Yimella sp. RIT 621]
MRFVLASASPARLATLRSAGVQPEVLVSDVDEPAATAEAEKRYGALEPAGVALILARAKCEDVAGRDEADDALVLGCDSVLEFEGAAHGKPSDSSDAIARWQRMRGKSGILHSGHWLIDNRDDGTGATFGVTASTVVHFADIDDEEIEAYVATGEPLYVAGAFTVDGLGGPFVTSIEGDYHNVVGVSLPALRELLQEIGISWHELRPAPTESV